MASSTAIGGNFVFTNATNQQAWLSNQRLVPVNAHHTDAVANAGTIWSAGVNRDYSAMHSYNQVGFVMKVRSATANVRFRVYNPASGSATLTNNAANCSSFDWVQIGL